MSDERLERLIENAINSVSDPCSVGRGTPIGIVDMGLLAGIDLDGVAPHHTVKVRLRVTSPGCMYPMHFEEAVRREISTISEVTSVVVSWDDAYDWDPSFSTPRVRHWVSTSFFRPPDSPIAIDATRPAPRSTTERRSA